MRTHSVIWVEQHGSVTGCVERVVLAARALHLMQSRRAVHPGMHHFTVSHHSVAQSALTAPFARMPEGVCSACRGGWIALSVARALHFLHCHGIAHLGVSPACVLLAPDGTAKLGDIGAARLLGPHTRRADPVRRT